MSNTPYRHRSLARDYLAERMLSPISVLKLELCNPQTTEMGFRGSSNYAPKGPFAHENFSFLKKYFQGFQGLSWT